MGVPICSQAMLLWLLLPAVSTVSSICQTCFVTRAGSVLKDHLEDGSTEEFTFSGVNIYWLGQDENNPDVPNGGGEVYTHPSQYRVDDVLMSALSMGSQVVRAHTVGVSTGTGEFHAWNMGWEGTVWPERGLTVEENFASMDYAVFRAGQLGLRLVVPLTDEWNYYHGGIHDFLGWRGPSMLDGVEGNCVCNMDQHQQDQFYTHPDVVSDFMEYVSVILNHVNPYTGIAYKDDPTILAWESGNELYYPTYNWTVNLARFIKEELGAQQLFLDGRRVSRTGFYSDLDDPYMLAKYTSVVDIISDHFYPMNIDKLLEMSAKANEYGLPYVIGEIGWLGADVDLLTFLAAVEQLQADGLVAGSLFWSMFGHAEQYGHVTHDDGYSMYWPTGPEPDSFHHNNMAYRTLMRNMSDHMFLMSNRDVPDTYLMSDIPPMVTVLECKPGQWIRVAFRGIAGAHLYKVVVDGHALAFIEDRQVEPTYVHNSVVQEGSKVLVIPYGYGGSGVVGAPSLDVICPSEM